MSDYRELREIILSHGLMETQNTYYVIKSIIAIATVAVCVAIVLAQPAWPWMLGTAALLGFAMTQIGLLAHDVAHRQAFRGRRSNRIARLFFGSLLLAASHTWWTQKHNQHHATPNHVDKDPDIQFPFLVFDPAQISNRARWLHPVIGLQAFIFVMVLPLQAVNMRYASLRHLMGPKARGRWSQLALIAVHFVLYGLLLTQVGSLGLAIAFAVVHHAVFGVYNSSVFASNHKGMPVIDDNARLDFLREQVLTSRNVHGHQVLDFWFGGLNFQIEHHLFPTMPRNNLRKAQPLVEEFCRRKGIEYHATNMYDSYREGLMHLHRAGASLRRG